MKMNSMFHWFPLVKDLDIPQPKTIMIPFTGKLDYDMLNTAGIEDGRLIYFNEEHLKDKDFKAFLDKVKASAKKIGYPLFMRSDETSNKFDWSHSCYVKSESDLFPNMCNIIEFIAMSFGLSFSGIALREFLDLDSRFTSHRGMPVAAEWRFFVREGEVECFHPYWPPASIQSPSIEDWHEVLDELQTMTPKIYKLLAEKAEMIGCKLGGYWSIDLCRHRKGTWYLTDMALGKDSYHWATCIHAPPEMMKHYGDPLKIEKESVTDQIIKFLKEKGVVKVEDPEASTPVS